LVLCNSVVCVYGCSRFSGRFVFILLVLWIGWCFFSDFSFGLGAVGVWLVCRVIGG